MNVALELIPKAVTFITAITISKSFVFMLSLYFNGHHPQFLCWVYTSIAIIHNFYCKMLIKLWSL